MLAVFVVVHTTVTSIDLLRGLTADVKILVRSRIITAKIIFSYVRRHKVKLIMTEDFGQ